MNMIAVRYEMVVMEVAQDHDEFGHQCPIMKAPLLWSKVHSIGLEGREAG